MHNILCDVACWALVAQTDSGSGNGTKSKYFSTDTKRKRDDEGEEGIVYIYIYIYIYVRVLSHKCVENSEGPNSTSILCTFVHCIV